MYVHWKSHALKVWKIGNLKGLSKRVFLVSSDDDRFKTEIDFLKKILIKKVAMQTGGNTLHNIGVASTRDNVDTTPTQS